MATAIATKPPPLHQKIKRPPAPVQTAINGNKSSQSSPSPSVSSKRPSSSFKQPPNATNGMGPVAAVNGGGPRLSNRRKDPQRPGDVTVRPTKIGKNGQGEAIDRRAVRRKPEPYGIPSLF